MSLQSIWKRRREQQLVAWATQRFDSYSKPLVFTMKEGDYTEEFKEKWRAALQSIRHAPLYTPIISVPIETRVIETRVILRITIDTTVVVV